jgi:hydrophobe/amphiphile efflux-3 (HAE3) family protein
MPFRPAANKKKWLQVIIDHPVPVITLMVLITFLFALPLPRLRFQTSIYDLTIQDLSETVRYESFKKEFGTEEIILVVVKAQNIFDPTTFNKVGELAETFSKIHGIRRVISLPGIKKDMDVTGKWSLSDFERIISPIALFSKNLLSADKKTTVISLILEDISHKNQVIDAVQKVIDREKKGLSMYQIGMPLVSKALGDYTERDFLRLPPITFLVMALILFCFFLSLRAILIPVGSVLVALTWTFGLMAWTRTPLSMLTMIVPVFIITVGTAYCMYIFFEYLESAKTSETSKESAFLCFSRVGFPTSLAVVTTLIGLGSLLLNKIEAIREFAIFACFGIISMLVIMVFFLPVVFSLLPFPKKGTMREPVFHGLFDRFLDQIVKIDLLHQKKTLTIIGLMSLLGIVGLSRIKVETNPVGYFKKDTPISRHFHDIYQDMAGSFPVNVVLDSKESDYFEDPAHLRMIERVQSFLDSLKGVDKTISFVDYLKLVNYVTNQHKPGSYVVPGEGFEVRMAMNSYKTMLGQDVFSRFMSEDLSKVNILLRTHISSSRDFLEIRKKILAYLQKNLPKNLDYQVTGFGIVISQSSYLLTKGQIRSLALTLILVFGVMLLLFLSGKVGLIAILPNCLPIVVSFGVMGWLGIELSVATSLIASIAIGLAVDDTIHYLARYDREFKIDLDKDRALRDTIKSVGKPMILTTLTISVGFSILLFSHFKPTAIFGFMMIIVMVSALMGDLILLPSLMRHVELVTAWDLLKLMPTQVGISAGTAHELNQPLNAIKMGSEFLKMMIQQGEKIPQEQLLQVINEMNAQVDRASQLINRLRGFDRKTGFAKERVNINRSVKNVMDIMGPQLRVENIELIPVLDETLPDILGHENKLAQVIYNLVLNARDAIDERRKEGESKPGSRVIRIHSFRENNRVAVTVSDTGVGIEKWMRARIFEPFFTTKEMGKAKGLGLSITSQIVRDHGGQIEVESEKGVGARFKVTFPLEN